MSVAGGTPITLDPSQAAAVDLMVCARIGIITGGPGTGKTTITRAALEIMESGGERCLLAAPTGKASKRLSEATGREAVTVHRLLKFDPSSNGFAHGEDCPLDASVVIVDEASMLDVVLGAALLSAIDRSNTRLLLVGDADQLPPVGPGQVFADLIASGAVPVARLTSPHRAAAKSWVCCSAQRIIAGKLPDLAPAPDFEFVSTADAGNIVPTVQKLVTGDGRFASVAPQVLAPQHTGVAGVARLNGALQDALNPLSPRQAHVRRSAAKGEESVPGTLRVGDPVIQRSNSYSLEVMNGELGRIRRVDRGRVTVTYFGGDVEYDSKDAAGLDLAYALTVHRTQGSEFDWVLVVCHSTHTFMLSRNLLYTAVTRAKKGVVIVGDQAGIRRATRPLRKDDVRLTALPERVGLTGPGSNLDGF
jgi:exodeoxyribonuclease V alpha subunit